MAFPIIFDIIAVTSHYVVIFTPHASNHNEILATTQHPQYYLDNIYDGSKRADSLSSGDWNAWTVWNTS